MTNWKEYKLGELVAIKNRSIGRNFEFKAIAKSELPYDENFVSKPA